MEDLFACGCNSNLNLCVGSDEAKITTLTKVQFPHEDYEIEQLINNFCDYLLICAKHRITKERCLLFSGKSIPMEGIESADKFSVLNLGSINPSSIKRVLGLDTFCLLLNDGSIYKACSNGFERVIDFDGKGISILAYSYFTIVACGQKCNWVLTYTLGEMSDLLKMPPSETVVNIYGGSYQFLIETSTTTGDQKFYFHGDSEGYKFMGPMVDGQEKLLEIHPKVYHDQRIKYVVIDWETILFVTVTEELLLLGYKDLIATKLVVEGAPRSESPIIRTCHLFNMYFTYPKAGEIWARGRNGNGQLNTGDCETVVSFQKIFDMKANPISKHPLKELSVNYQSILVWFKTSNHALFTSDERRSATKLIPTVHRFTKPAFGDVVVFFN